MPSDLSNYTSKVSESLCVLLEETYHVQTYTNGRDLLRVRIGRRREHFDATAKVELFIDGAGCPSRVEYMFDYEEDLNLYSNREALSNYRQLSKYFCGRDKYYTDEQGILKADRSEENILACVEKVITFHAARCGVPVETFKR